MSGTRRYYVVGNAVQVRNKAWLSPFPTGPREVKAADILRALEPRADGKPFVIFNNFEDARTCAEIKTNNDNPAGAPSLYYRPVIEVTLKNENELKLELLSIEDGFGSRLTTNTPRTTANNIRSVHSCYYRAGSQEHRIPLENNPVVAQKILPSPGCRIM